MRLNVNTLSGTMEQIMNQKSVAIEASGDMFLNELQVCDTVKRLGAHSHLSELQDVAHKTKQVRHVKPRASTTQRPFRQQTRSLQRSV